MAQLKMESECHLHSRRVTFYGRAWLSWEAFSPRSGSAGDSAVTGEVMDAARGPRLGYCSAITRRTCCYETMSL